MADNKPTSLHLRSRPPVIRAQIVFPQDEVGGYNGEPLRAGGEELAGNLLVSLGVDTNFVVDVAFEGYVRTWVSENGSDPFMVNARSVGQIKFLEETQTLSSFSVRSNCDDEGRTNAGSGEGTGSITVQLPFSFIVPRQLISAQGDVVDEFLGLPPSTKLGQGYTGPCGGLRYGQPNITYSVRVLRILTAAPPDLSACNNWSSFTCPSREITIRPIVTPGPPVEAAHFPSEYNVRGIATLRRLHSLYRLRKLGVLTVTAAEPAPINTLVHTAEEHHESKAPALRPSTTAYLLLTLTPCRLDLAAISPPTCTVAVTHYVRSRSFFSTRPMTQAPTCQTVKGQKGCMRFTDRKSRPETHEYRLDASHWSWTIDGWKSTLPVCVSAAQASLVPTFLNQLSARRYAAVLRVGIEGMRHRAIELVVPLQVVSCALPASQNDDEVEEDAHVEESLPSDLEYMDDDLANFGVDASQMLISPPPYKAGTYF